MEKDLQKHVSDLQKNVIDCIAAIYENLVLGHKYQLSELNEAEVKFPNAVFEEVTSASIRYTGPRWAIGLLAEGLTLLEYTVTGFGHQQYEMDPCNKCVIEVKVA